VELYERGITAETQPLDFPAHVDDRGIVMVQETIPSALSTSRGIPAQLFAALISSSDDAIIVKSLDGVIWTWNQGAMRMYGYTPDAAIGQPMTMLSPPDRVGEIADILVKIRKGERVSHYETTRQRKDGTTFPASMSVFPVNDEYGNMVGAASIARDITEESQARRAAALAIRNKDIELDNRNLTSFNYSVSPPGTIWLQQSAAGRMRGCSRRRRPRLRRANRCRQPANVHTHRELAESLPLHASHHPPPDRRPQHRDR
jgi:PAS domain S-box-containing protein